MVVESINSLISQSYSNLEILLVDDCSTDNTYSELKRFETDGRVRVVRNPCNKGFTKSLLDTINSSKGKVIAIHGSGDISHPERIEKQLKLLLSSENIGVVGCEDQNIFKDGTVARTNRWPVKPFYESMTERTSRKPYNGAHLMFKKSFHDLVGGYRDFFEFAQDCDFMCRLSLVCEYDVVPEVLYYYKRHVANSVSGDPIKRMKQIFFMTFAIQCIKFRKRYGFDYVDSLDGQAFVAFHRNSEASNKLAIHALRLYLEGDIEGFNSVMHVVYTQKITAKSLFLILIHRGIVPLKFSSLIYKYLRKSQ
jgi:glycosyltransferase involved in cell wall biosynthesis